MAVRGVALAAMAVVAAAACSSSEPERCQGAACPKPPQIEPTPSGPPTVTIGAPSAERFYRAGTPVEVSASVTGSVRTLDVVLDGDVAGCRVVQGEVVQHFGSPPFVGVLDTSGLAPGVHTVDVLVADAHDPPRCDTDRRVIHVDRTVTTEVVGMWASADAKYVAILAGPGAAQPGLHRATVRGDRLRFLSGDVAAQDVAFAARGNTLGYVAGRGVDRRLFVDDGVMSDFVASAVSGFALSPSGDAVAYTSGGTAAIAWYRHGALTRHALGAGGDVVFAGSGEGVVVVTPMEDRQALSLFRQDTGEEVGDVQDAVRFWPGAHRLIVERLGSGAERLIEAHAFGASVAPQVLAVTNEMASVTMSSDGRTLAIAADGRLSVWRDAGGSAFEKIGEESGRVLAARVAPDGASVALVRDSETGETIDVWQAPTAASAASVWTWLDQASAGEDPIDLAQLTFADRGGAMAFLGHGTLWLAAAGSAAGAPVDTNVVGGQVSFSAGGGDHLAYRGLGSDVGAPVLNVVEVATGRRTIVPTRAGVARYAWSPSDAVLVTQEGTDFEALCEGGCFGRVALWSVAPGPGLHKERQLSGDAELLGFAPDGSFVLARGLAWGATEMTGIITRSR